MGKCSFIHSFRHSAFLALFISLRIHFKESFKIQVVQASVPSALLE